MWLILCHGREHSVMRLPCSPSNGLADSLLVFRSSSPVAQHTRNAGIPQPVEFLRTISISRLIEMFALSLFRLQSLRRNPSLYAKFDLSLYVFSSHAYRTGILVTDNCLSKSLRKAGAKVSLKAQKIRATRWAQNALSSMRKLRVAKILFTVCKSHTGGRSKQVVCAETGMEWACVIHLDRPCDNLAQVAWYK